MLESELESSLTRNGFSTATVKRVLAALRDKRIVDDPKTINNLIARRTGKRTVGIEKMRHELIAKGAPEELVEQGLAAVTMESQSDGMRALLAAKCKREDGRAKGARLLLSRGFDADVIETVLDEFFGSEEFPD